MTQSDSIQSVSDVRDMEVVKEEVIVQIEDTKHECNFIINSEKKLQIARDHVERFTFDELVELTGVPESTVHHQIKFWLLTGQIVEVGQKKWDKSVYSCRPVDIGLAGEGSDDEISTQQAEVADRFEVTDAVVQDMFEAIADSANSDSAGEGGDSQNEGDDL